MNLNILIALGDAFGHMSQLRIQLSWKMNKREARVLKSPHLRESSTFFQITVRKQTFLYENF
jgi:hypothetical protein